ncbi:MAG: zf-HC2 domain-containing protein [Bacillus sp. (in: firmicutes)]
MKCSDEMIVYMHEYLDEEISKEHEDMLRNHLRDCNDCKTYFHELKRAIALVQSTSHIVAPDDFTSRVMAALPKEKRKVGIQRWFKKHPFFTAASLFTVLMGGALVSSWQGDQQLSFSSQPQLQVEQDTVIVPEGTVVTGDIVVRNGNIRIEGEVDGDVTVINGEKLMASAGNVTGDIQEVDQIFEWIWFKMKESGKEVIRLFKDEQEKVPSN